jgi:hypothetical protein
MTDPAHQPDPTAGSPSAIETARLFGLDDLVALFEGR